MLEKILAELIIFVGNAKLHMPFMLQIMAGLWIINLANWATDSKLNMLGITPRTRSGLLGVIFSSILHKDFQHLFFNSIPLFALGLLILGFGINIFYNATLIIIAIEGVLVWLLARKANHIGASGLTAGYFSFIITLAYKEHSVISILFLLGLVAIYYFGGILLSFIPTTEKDSWEGHLFGLIAGVAAFFIIFKLKILPLRYISSWMI